MAQTATAIELDALHGDVKPPTRPTTVQESPGIGEDISDNDAVVSSSAASEDAPSYSLLRTSVIFASLTGVTLASSMSNGVLAVALPKIAEDLNMPDYLMLWPASIYGLTCGCTLLVAGAVADVIGSRIVYLTGCLLLSVFMLGGSFSQTSTQLIVLRGLQGIAASCCFPTAVSILSESFSRGRRRNIGFALLGSGQPLGYSLGLFLGGFFVDSASWRAGWYCSGGMAFVTLIAAVWALPPARPQDKLTFARFLERIDLVGALISSAALGMLSYVLAVVAEGTAHMSDPANIVILCLGCALIPGFALWMDFRVKHNKPALIPNHLWKKLSFSSICVMVFLTWAVLQTVEYYFSLFFQKVQGLSALQASIRFLPNVLVGAILNIVTGMVLHKWSAYWMLLTWTIISAVSPLLLAITEPSWPYWYTLFPAMLVAPLAADSLFVISNILITNVFPDNTQALAGAVFNTVSQFGNSVGLAIMAAISSSVTDRSRYSDKNSPRALLEGYRASFWACLSATLLSCAIGAVGLRKVGKVGLKKD